MTTGKLGAWGPASARVAPKPEGEGGMVRRWVVPDNVKELPAFTKASAGELNILQTVV